MAIKSKIDSEYKQLEHLFDHSSRLGNAFIRAKRYVHQTFHVYNREVRFWRVSIERSRMLDKDLSAKMAQTIMLSDAKNYGLDSLPEKGLT